MKPIDPQKQKIKSEKAIKTGIILLFVLIVCFGAFFAYLITQLKR